MVSIADEERRRIGRNLHDGAQQRMIVLGHRIELARRKLEQDPEQAAEHLRHAGEEARAAGAELRELARGLHPAGLTEYGLEPALAALAGRSPMPLEIVALPDRRLPEAVEVTIYYLVSEALSNAVKYAGASAVRVEVAQGADRVVAEVADDGAGGADPAAGSGLAGLSGRDRGARRHARRRSARRARARGCGPASRSRPWRTAREPFLEFGHADDGGAGARADRQGALRREDRLDLARPRVGARGRHAEDRPAPARHGPPRPPPRHRRGRPDRGHAVRRGRRGLASRSTSRASAPTSGAPRQRDYYDRCREQVAALLEEPGWRLTDAEPLVVLRFKLVDDA